VAAFEYDDDPHRLDEYVSVDELTGLITAEGRPFYKDSKRLLHFLTRVRTTLLAFRQQIQNLHRDVQAANIRATSIGTPTSLDPRSAAKFLPPEEIATLADELVKQKLAAISASEEEVRSRRADLLRRLNSVKFAVETIAEDYTIPQEIRDRITAAFANPLTLPAGFLEASSPEQAHLEQAQSNPEEPGLDDLFG
jgi:hypothetical protein